MKKTKKRVFGVMIGAAALALLSPGCKPEEEVKGEQEIKPIAVEIDEVETSRFVQTFSFPGIAEPIEQRRVAAESSGRVLDAPFEEGASIEKGALLLRVDAKTTGAQINLLRSQASTAKRELNRIKQLTAEGLATPQQLDQSNAQLEQANLALKQARVGASMAVVRSPFSGVVASKFVEPGEFTSPGQAVAEIIDTSTIKLEVTIPESAVGFVSQGDEVDVEFPSSNKSAKGKVIRRGVRVTQPTQTFPIEIHIPNEDGEILPGMRARVVIPKLTIDDAVVVRRDALLEGVLRREAMVATEIQGDIGKAELRIVDISEARGNEIVVTKGLDAGDKLIVLGHRNVVDGTPIRVVRDHSNEEMAEAPEKRDAPESAQAEAHEQ